MSRLPLLSLFAVLTLAAAAGCIAHRPVPLEPWHELESLRNRDLKGFMVGRASLGSAPFTPISVFDPSDGLDEAEVVSVALTLNPTLRAKRLEVGEARALLITAGLWPNPEVGIGWRPGIDGSSGYNANFEALFQLLRPGERAARRAAAEARVDEVRAEIVAQEFNTVADVRSQWLNVMVAGQAVRLFEEEVALRERVLGLVRDRRRPEIGEATELDVSSTELELAETRRELRKSQAGLAAERRELNRLIGLPAEYPLPLADAARSLTISVFDDVPDDEIDRRILAGRFDLKAREAAYRRAEEDLRLAVLGQYPRLGVGPAFERELDGGKSLGIGLSLELPILNRNQGQIAAAQAVRDQRRAEYVAALHGLRAAAFDARAAARLARAEVEIQEREVLPLVRRNQELFEGAFRAGERDVRVIDWIAAQQRTVRARREYLDALVRYRQNLTRLEAATGLSLSQPATRPTTRPTTQFAPGTGQAPP